MARDEPDDARDVSPADLGGHLLVYLREPTLWPVLTVAIAIGTTFGGSALLLALRDRNGFAIAALAIVGIASAELCLRDRRRGGFGLVSGVVVGGWVLCALAAGTAIGLGWY